MAEVVGVAGGRDLEISGLGFACGGVAEGGGEGGGEVGVEGGGGLGGFAAEPWKLAAGVEDHGDGLRRGANGEGDS